MGKNVGDAVVKIDSELLRRVEDFIKLPLNKYKYINRKQFIDSAVFEFLKNGLQTSTSVEEKKVVRNG